MSETLVSVVIPTYSRPRVLKRALDSVLNQTYRNLDIIVVDDNADSAENRAEVARIVNAANDPRVTLIQNEKNLGGSLTRNAGIARAKGEYIAFLDDDDEYLPERIARQLERFRQTELPNVALVYCHTVTMLSSTESAEEYRYTFRGNCVFDGMCDCIAATSQWMCRKDALLAVGCFSDVPCKQDSTVIVKLLVHGYAVDYVPEILSRYYRDAGAGISTQGHRKRVAGEEALRALCRAHYALITPAQQKEVEYHAACRLLEHYRALGMRREAAQAWRTILRFPLKRKTLSVVKRNLLNR